MPRARTIKPDLYKNETLAECSIAARLLFPALWCWADRDGRLEDRPKRLKAEIFPYDDVDVSGLLDELHNRGFITRYEVGGARVIQVNKFHKHQKPHPKEVSYNLPTLPENFPVEPRNFPAVSVGCGLLVDGCGLRVSSDCSELDKPTPEPPVPPFLILPCVGTGPREYPVTEADVAEWSEAYPGIDVRDEIRRAVQWARDNPKRRKTHSGARRFLSSWLARSQDRARPTTHQQDLRTLGAHTTDEKPPTREEAERRYRAWLEQAAAVPAGEVRDRIRAAAEAFAQKNGLAVGEAV